MPSPSKEESLNFDKESNDQHEQAHLFQQYLPDAFGGGLGSKLFLKAQQEAAAAGLSKIAQPSPS